MAAYPNNNAAFFDGAQHNTKPVNNNNSMNTDHSSQDTTINSFTLSNTSMADFDMPTGTTLSNTYTTDNNPNQPLIDEIVRNPDQYLFQKFENFKTNAKKGKVLKAATQKKKVAKTRGGGAS
ncbi:hypothetical protein B0A48_04910 [Cryoendolithus antarcticus]|uniref:Uncharacterized protein n=1 Tax=Cryoendolithus antarcticus TaxID=1507870 RepID=A0A1V8TE44_9PEZI|nr:hypothetical protein B0A48_04910 [Cryoendolithus antarcticus]